MGWYRTLTELRMSGWSVAVHNDYFDRTSQKHMTFWLLTKPVSGVGMVAVKGEGETDELAIMACAEQVRALYKPLALTE